MMEMMGVESSSGRRRSIQGEVEDDTRTRRSHGEILDRSTGSLLLAKTGHQPPARPQDELRTPPETRRGKWTFGCVSRPELDKGFPACPAGLFARASRSPGRGGSRGEE